MRETDYTDYYSRITEGIRRRAHGREHLRAADRVLTGIMYAAYPVLLILCFVSGYAGRPFLLQEGPGGIGETETGLLAACRSVLPFILVPGISFVLVSLVRDRINRKRPYEKWPIDPLIHKNTKGHSMPSRHVFSSALISMCWLSVNAPAGVVLLILTLCAAVVRVLGGVHYPGDVTAGYAAGVAAGALLWIV